MSIHDTISEELNPLMEALMANDETRQIMEAAIADAQKVLEKRNKENMLPTVTGYWFGQYETVSFTFPTLAEALQYVAHRCVTGRIETSFDTFEVVKGKGVPKRFSKKRLLPLLKHMGFIEKDTQVGFEAFGRNVQAFIGVKSMEERRRLESTLRLLGQSVNESYCPGYPRVEVGVSYFKAWHWDE